MPATQSLRASLLSLCLKQPPPSGSEEEIVRQFEMIQRESEEFLSAFDDVRDELL